MKLTKNNLADYFNNMLQYIDDQKENEVPENEMLEQLISDIHYFIITECQ